jgi:hypothetical protein
MTKFLFAAAAATLAFASPALAGERQFSHQGVTYTYTTEIAGKGRVLKGTASKGGRFELFVQDGWVRGNVDGTRVSFAAPRKSASISVAAR